MSEERDDTDALMNALHEAAQNRGELVLPREIYISGRRYDPGVYQLRFVRCLPSDRGMDDDHPF